MNKFLKEFCLAYPNRRVVMVMDGASWHKSSGLNKSKNYRIIIQPPYSPEINPVETLWQYIKGKILKNRLYIKLDEIEQALCNFFQTITEDSIRNICNVNYI